MLAASILAAGCSDGGLIEITHPPEGGAGSGAGAATGGGGAAGSTGTGGGGKDAGVSPVLVGITPTPASPNGAPTPATELEAHLTSIAAGSRAAVITLSWDADLAAEIAALSKEATFYAAHGGRVLVSLPVVDRSVDHRPASAAGSAWSAPATIDAVKATIDALFAATGDEVRYLTLGRDADVYLAAHPDDRPGFAAFAKEAAAYAKAHPDAPKELGVGVAFTTAAPKQEPTFQDLVASQDVIGFSYFPGLGTFEPGASSDVAATVTQIADVAGDMPIVLQAAGLATDPAAGGGEDAQQKFFATLFGAVAARRRSFALVNVVELFDAPDDACLAWAEEQGDAPEGPLAAYACSLGLFEDDGTPRPAWSSVLAGSAALSTP